MYSMKSKKDILLQHIANHLILHLHYLEDIGLFHGKMGIILFFAHYARYTNIAMYDDFAEELLNDLCENIPENSPINLEFGLCGIGWGIEYLIRNKFMEGNSNDILIDIDQKIMERDLRRIKDYSLATGLMGISCYIQFRLQGGNKNRDNTPFDNIYLSEWRKKIISLNIWNEREVLSYLIKRQSNEIDYLPKELGLVDGCAGIGIKYMY